MFTISVIIPTYKNRGGLSRAIASVLAQDFEGGLEVVVVDDNDPDTEFRTSTELLMDTFANNPKIKYIKHSKNRNGAAARNTGLMVATGEFIAFLDDDDWFLNKKLSKQVEFLNSYPELDAVYCFARKEGNSIINTRVVSQNGIRDILLLKSNIRTSTLFIRRSVCLKLNGFDESFCRHQDYEFMLRFFKNGFKLGCIPEVLVGIGKNEGENIQIGNKLEALKNYYFERFSQYIEEEDSITSGFANEVYVVHYAGVFLSHVKNGYWFMALKIFMRYFFRAPLVFFGVLWGNFMKHLTRNT